MTPTIPTAVLNDCSNRTSADALASANTGAAPLPVVVADSFLTLHYRITLVKEGQLLGDFLNTFDDKPATLLMGAGQLSPALEAGLMGLAQGTHTVIELPAGVAFGQRNADMMQRVSMTLLRTEAELGTAFEVGDLIEFNAAQGRMAGAIVALDDTAALMDFNHPLAGQAVAFEVKVLAVL
jgi:FKBP-type peptidyl-prolyl cis-trans isomerase SlpA